MKDVVCADEYHSHAACGGDITRQHARKSELADCTLNLMIRRTLKAQ
jgi:hypothetical protein